MKYFSFLLLFLSLSCTGASQEARLETATDSISPPQKLTLIFAGDLMQHQGQIDAARTTRGFDYSDCFKYVKEEISKADIAIGNLEVTLGGKPYAGYPTFSAPDEYLAAIKDAGFDVLTTANNHCLDRGKKGLERTLLMLDSLNLSHAGTYVNATARVHNYPLLIEQNGFRIALLSYTYGTNGIKVTAPNVVNYIDREQISADIDSARLKRPDAIIACMHWGNEYQSLPSPEQASLADWLIEHGVTHIIGCHPHVVQPLELRTDSLRDVQHVVAYSLGNFISNMTGRRTDGGLVFKLELTKDTARTYVSDCGYSLVWTARPVLSQKKNYTLYPLCTETNSLPKEARNRLKIFVNDTRTLFRKHNLNIDEYFLYKKIPAEYLEIQR